MNAPFRRISSTATGEQLARAVEDFLHALDRGDYGASALQHDGHESAHVADMRVRLVEHRAGASLIADAHRRGESLADELYGARP